MQETKLPSVMKFDGIASIAGIRKKCFSNLWNAAEFVGFHTDKGCGMIQAMASIALQMSTS